MWSSLSNMAPDTYKKAITSLGREMKNYLWEQLCWIIFGANYKSNHLEI